MNAVCSMLCLTLIFCVNFHLTDASTSNDDQLEAIFLRLYGTTMDQFRDAKAKNVLDLVPDMNFDLKIVMYIHGFSESADSDSAQTMAQAYMIRGDHNILIADYRNISNLAYPIVATKAHDVGKVLASALDQLVSAGFDPQKIHIVGHSMGSQVASQVGKQTNFTVPRITGLDPAGPFFNLLEAHLASTDAGYVDVIHTDYGIYGMARTTGTVDFFPNGGHRLQPGCPYGAAILSPDDFCSHKRSWRYYAESVINEESFIATKCSGNPQFNAGMCNNNEKVAMGISTPPTAKGTFYLVTAAQSPFGKGELGARP